MTARHGKAEPIAAPSVQDDQDLVDLRGGVIDARRIVRCLQMAFDGLELAYRSPLAAVADLAIERLYAVESDLERIARRP